MPSSKTTASREIPSEDTVADAARLEVFDVKGQKVTFGSLFESQKTIMVFIRHFFCGSCQAFVQKLAAIPKEALDKANTKIVVIGCGEWNPIEFYIETTNFHGPIYADPSRSLYRAFSMIENLEGAPSEQERKSYLPKSSFNNAVQSTWRALKHPSLVGKQGNISQLGGEFIFGPGFKCTFAWRMEHTEDHTEIAQLMKEAGVEVA